MRKLKDHVEKVEVIALRHAGQVQVEAGTLADVLNVEVDLGDVDPVLQIFLEAGVSTI